VASDDKTERATDKRRQELRNKGQLARSPEVMTAFVLGSGLLGLMVGAGNLYRELGGYTRRVLGHAAQMSLAADSFPTVFAEALGVLVRGTGVLFLAAVAGAILGNVVQVGFMVSWEALAPDINKLNPLTGLKNLFQWAKLVDLLKGVLKVVVVTWVAYLSVRGRLAELPAVALLPAGPLLGFTVGLGFEILKNVLLVYVVIALVDYLFQRWQWEEKNKMSKEEVKDEHKQSEGDPLVRSRIRTLQREMARRRMMAEVPKADVVVTNPTHFAVALRYDAEEDAAPAVVAKGVDLVARRIIETAEEHGVPLYQAPPVARALFHQVELGETVPAQMFQAVAEILAHVYRLSRRSIPG
jgi:flagellar biosynthetic protein FlhB